jgi:hypothetical protein
MTSVSERVRSGSLLAAMGLGSFALWIAIPAGWLYATRDLDPIGARFVLVVVGCIFSMAGAAVILHRLEAAYVRLAGRPVLDTILVISAVAAIVALVLWWAFLADNPSPSGPLQPL